MVGARTALLIRSLLDRGRSGLPHLPTTLLVFFSFLMPEPGNLRDTDTLDQRLSMTLELLITSYIAKRFDSIENYGKILRRTPELERKDAFE